MRSRLTIGQTAAVAASNAGIPKPNAGNPLENFAHNVGGKRRPDRRRDDIVIQRLIEFTPRSSILVWSYGRVFRALFDTGSDNSHISSAIATIAKQDTVRSRCTDVCA